MSKSRDIADSAATINVLDGVTTTPAELNILGGVTSTSSELNILDGVTSTAAELNILDGVTSTATELNHLVGVTSAIQTQIDTLDPLPTQTGNTGKFLTTNGTAASWGVVNARAGATDNYSCIFSNVNDVPLTRASSSAGLITGDWLMADTGGAGSLVSDIEPTQIGSKSWSSYYNSWFGLALSLSNRAGTAYSVMKSADGVHWTEAIYNVNNNLTGQFRHESEGNFNPLLAVDDVSGYLWILTTNGDTPFNAYANYLIPSATGIATWGSVSINTGGLSCQAGFLYYVNHATNPGLVVAFRNDTGTLEVFSKVAGTGTAWVSRLSSTGMGTNSNECYFNWNADDQRALIGSCNSTTKTFYNDNPVNSAWTTVTSSTSGSTDGGCCVGDGGHLVTWTGAAAHQYSTDSGTTWSTVAAPSSGILKQVVHDGTQFIYYYDTDCYTGTASTLTINSNRIAYGAAARYPSAQRMD